jgi:predicted nucleic acid-binding protein
MSALVGRPGMKYLLDSNTISEIYDSTAEHHATISRHIQALTDRDQMYISVVCLYELEYGWANAPDLKKPDIRQVIGDVQNDFRMLSLSAQSAKVFGELKKKIKDARASSQDNMKKFNVDLMLASTAITTQSRLVSADRLYEELQRYYSAFQVENWTV